MFNRIKDIKDHRDVRYLYYDIAQQRIYSSLSNFRANNKIELNKLHEYPICYIKNRCFRGVFKTRANPYYLYYNNRYNKYCTSRIYLEMKTP